MSVASLPAGFQAQPAYQFRDPSGRFSYEFAHVYGPPQAGVRGLVCQLDRDRSYWSVVGQIDDAGQETPARRSISYAEARRTLPGQITFAQFASEMHMRRALPTLTGITARITSVPAPRS